MKEVGIGAALLRRMKSWKKIMWRELVIYSRNIISLLLQKRLPSLLKMSQTTVAYFTESSQQGSENFKGAMIALAVGVAMLLAVVGE